MSWFITAILLVIPLASFFAAWQAYLLLVGKTAYLSKQFAHLPPERYAVASKQYGYLCATTAIAMLALPVAIVSQRLPFTTWSQLLTIASSCTVLWAWLLNRRYGQPDA